MKRHVEKDRGAPLLYADLPRKAHQLGDLLIFAEWLQASGREPIDLGDPSVTASWRNLENRLCVILHRNDGSLIWTQLAAADFREYLRARNASNDEPFNPRVD